MKLMDWNALIKTVQTNPNIHFVFIGPDQPSNIGGSKTFAELDTIKSFPNTYFTGSMSKKELASVLPLFDAFLMSYDHQKYPIHVSNSHKILEYLSTGKTIVSNFTSTYSSYSLLEMVEQNNLLPDKLATVIQNLNQYNVIEKQKERMKYALDNTYPKQISRIEKLLHS